MTAIARTYPVLRETTMIRAEVVREAYFQGGHPLVDRFVDAHRDADGAYRNPGAGKPGGGLQAFIEYVEAMDVVEYLDCVTVLRDAIYGRES
jgi:hypothetical protein